ncbi:MAG: AcrR family transcriptional regulator [Candidatus Aldehydirespiratoraceae bacterium]
MTESEVVLKAAGRRLASHGIAGTTVDDVAAEAGVSRATVYRYIGGKNEIVPAVIGREAQEVLDRVAGVLTASITSAEAVADAVSTALVAIGENPVLARLTSTDLIETLPFITADAASLVDVAVSTLSPAMRAAPALNVDDHAVEAALEEATRFVLLHLTTPRLDGSRLAPSDAGQRAAVLIAPMLEPALKRR